MLARMWSNRNSHSLLVGMQNDTDTLEDSLALSYKTKHTLTTWASNCTLGYLPKIPENLCSHKNLHMDAHRSIIYNSQNLQPSKRSFSRWLNKETVVHSDNGILFNTKKKWTIKSWKDMEEPQMHITKWKKPIWKGYILWFQLYDIMEKAKLCRP